MLATRLSFLSGDSWIYDIFKHNNKGQPNQERLPRPSSSNNKSSLWSDLYDPSVHLLHYIYAFFMLQCLFVKVSNTFINTFSSFIFVCPIEEILCYSLLFVYIQTYVQYHMFIRWFSFKKLSPVD